MTAAAVMLRGLDALNSLDAPDAEAALLRCCGSRRWAGTMRSFRPFHTEEALLDAARDVWRALTRNDWLQAFAAHPRIGERLAAGARWSAAEQAGAAGAEDDVLSELNALNAEYEARFGYVFIICATGRNAEEMLSELKRRIELAPREELLNAAQEQERITALRLGRLLTELEAS
jgi:OHCU decarboxylase